MLLFKRGDNTNLQNYGPISFFRLSRKLYFYQPVEQAEFQSEYSTSDHLQTLRALTAKTTEYYIFPYILHLMISKQHLILQKYVWSGVRQGDTISQTWDIARQKKTDEGLVLFIVYVNDLHMELDGCHNSITQFADDTNLLVS